MQVEYRTFAVELVKFIDECLAPGTYCPEKIKLDNAPQFTFGLKTSLNKPSDTPGKSIRNKLFKLQ